MVDWMQIGKDYFLFILFIIACIIYIIYKIYEARRLKKEAESASLMMMKKPTYADIKPAWEPPAQMMPRPPPIPTSEVVDTQTEFEDDTDEVPIQAREEKVEEMIKTETGNEGFLELFDEKLAKQAAPKQTDVMTALAHLTEDMKTNSEVLQGTLEDDLSTLRTKLTLITQRREEIKKYGKLLGDLYRKYEHREKQLQIMVIGLERLEEIRDSGIEPSIRDQ